MAAFFLISCFQSNAQNPICLFDEAYNTSSPTPPSFVTITPTTNDCNNLLKYIPDYQVPLSQHNELTIRVSVVFIRDISGNSSQFNNYSEDYAQQLNFFSQINAQLVSLNPPNLPNPNPTLEQTNIKIRLELDDVYYENDPLLSEMPSTMINDTPGQQIYTGMQMLYDQHGKNKTTTMNLFYTNISTAVVSSGFGIGYSAQGNRGAYMGMLGSGPMVVGSQIYTQNIGLFIHELGHTFTLPHSFRSVPNLNLNIDDIGDTPTTEGSLTPTNGNNCQVEPCSNNYMNYNYNSRSYFSPKQIAVMRRHIENNFDVHPGEEDNHNRYLSTLNECEKNSSEQYIVGSEEVWKKAVVMDRDVVIGNKKQLTIECKVSMAKGASIIVEPGGRLILDEALLTNSCGEYWRGIKLKGDANNHQYFIPNNFGRYYQGYLESKNSIIENAVEAVEVINDNGWQSGGIINATNTTFKNNQRCVSFQSYHNFNPSVGFNPSNPYLNERRNTSIFKKCDFINTRNLSTGNNPLAFVTMWDVKGVSFNGCTFQSTNPEVTDVDQLGIAGIYAIDAEFYVDEYCDGLYTLNGCPESQKIPSQFINLNAGIRAKKISNDYNFTASNSKFTDCVYGVYNEGHNRLVIYNNKFRMGDNITNSTFYLGLFVETGTDYTIEENLFGNSPLASGFIDGTIIKNTGMLANEVYKNVFDNIRYGNVSLGNNRNNLPVSQQTFVGLEYRCNDMLTSKGDIQVEGQMDPNGGISDDGINLNQGVNWPISQQISAGNLFTPFPTPSTINPRNINKLSWWPIYYYYGTSNPRENPIRISLGVNPLEYTIPSKWNQCLEQYGRKLTKRFPLTLMEKNEILLNSEITHSNIAALRTTYQQNLDGGNTQQNINSLLSAIPAQAQQIKNNLIQQSPYLSSDVLKKAIEQNSLLSNAMLFEILTVNPDGIRGEELKRLLREKQNPFPEEWVDYLTNLDGVVTSRTLLEFLIGANQRQLEENIYSLIKDAYNDSLYTDYAYIESLLRKNKGLHNDYLLFDVFLSQGKFTEASSLVDSLLIKYPKLSPATASERNDFIIYGNLLLGVRQENRNLKNITPSEYATLETLALNGERIPNVRAKSWLQLIDQPLDWYIPDFTDGGSAKKASTSNLKTISNLKVSPNPTRGVVYVDLTNSIYLGGEITVVNSQGIELEHLLLTDKPSVSIDLAKYPAGLYLLQFKSIRGDVHIEKVMLQ